MGSFGNQILLSDNYGLVLTICFLLRNIYQGTERNVSQILKLVQGLC